MASVFMPGPGFNQTSLVRPGAGSRGQRARNDEDLRCFNVERNRAYYHGTQFDQLNYEERERLGIALTPEVPLPEHRRLHNYAIQIAECVDFIANQLTNGFQVIADDPKVQDVIDRAIDASDALHNDSDDEIALEDIIIDGALAGDTPYEVLWDPVEQTVYWEFWDACQVTFDVPRGKWVNKVTREQDIWVKDVDANGQEIEREVHEKVIYDLADRTDLETLGVRECRKTTYWNGSPEPESVEWLGLPFIPWGVLRIDHRGLRGFRGDPLVTRKAIDNADRYNANEQTAYLIARYNSFGHLAVVGDQAFIKLELEPHIGVDIADVLRFPGGTDVKSIILPTDPTMIEHTRAVTADAIYASFGLVRVEPDTLNGIGGVSGYALEILNRKSEGTFRKVRRTFKTDFSEMLNKALDVSAYRQAVTLDGPVAEFFENNPEEEVPEFLLPEVNWWDIDPKTVFANRDIEIRMGTGYIVDDVLIRDNFTAKLYSQQEALRQLGYSDPDIERIMEEQKEAQQTALEGTLLQRGLNPDGTAIDPPVATAGDSAENSGRKLNGKPVPSGTAAGSTVGSSSRQ